MISIRKADLGVLYGNNWQLGPISSEIVLFRCRATGLTSGFGNSQIILKQIFIITLESCCLQLNKRRNSFTFTGIFKFQLCSNSSWLLPTWVTLLGYFRRESSFSTPKSKQFFSVCHLIKASGIPHLPKYIEYP